MSGLPDAAAQAARALGGLAEAPDDREAWRHWRVLERGWDALAPDDRQDLKALARRLLAGAPDGSRRLAVVEQLPG